MTVRLDPSNPAARRASYAALDEALALLAAYGPETASGLTNHAPMAVEALCALGRPDAVIPWLERYRPSLRPGPPARERIARGAWRSALARPERAGDWSAFFAAELEEAPWREVLARWVGRLAPGLCASATHGVLRVGHAARGLADAATAPRLRELADALASWASTYQELPRAADGAARPARPRDAIASVQRLPPERRRFTGAIDSSLVALDAFPAFAPVIGLADVSGDPSASACELGEVFARVYLANARDVLGAIVFVHGVTSVAALASVLPHLDAARAGEALRFAWQAGAALYAAFGSAPPLAAEGEPPGDGADDLVERAVAHGDEHAIKFTEACLRLDALAPSPVYAAAARHALGALPRP
jgi:hypothetical protein